MIENKYYLNKYMQGALMNKAKSGSLARRRGRERLRDKQQLVSRPYTRH